MVETGNTELTIEQLENLCESTEQVTRDYILSQVPIRKISDFDITIKAEGSKPVNIDVEVFIVLSPIMKDFNVESLTKEATKRAFNHIEKYFRELKCISKK